MRLDRTKGSCSQINIRRQLRNLLLTISIPLIGIITGLLIIVLSINSQYHSVLQNANTAADFNQEFKQTIDQMMYNHVIQPRTGQDENDLPMGVLDEAVDVLHRLDATTVLRNNRWRIRSMLNMCENLRGYMIEIAHSERYDERMELLERNIRGETGLTVLIETYMNGYINDEVRELARLERQIGSQMRVLISGTIIVVVLLIAGMLWYSVSVSRRISQPIGALAEKVQHVGETDLDMTSLNTEITELQTLDHGINDMAQRIYVLMDKQIENQRSLHRAELELLQAQINPHFLYNTLDSIAILAEMERGEDVIKMVTSLSVFFRNSLSRGQDIISLQAEKEQVTSYLEIQQIRYSDILTYEIDIPDELLACRVPKLILQPLVENALYHGIKYKRAMGKIIITGEAVGDDLYLRVSDNGAGMNEEQMQTLQAGIYADNHTGLGLVNVHKRVRLYCGEHYGLTFQSQPGEGTTVMVHLPKNIRPMGKESV